MLKDICFAHFNGAIRRGRKTVVLLLTGISFLGVAKGQTGKVTDSTKQSKGLILPRSGTILFGQKMNDSLNMGATGYLRGEVFESSPASFIFHGLTGRIAGLSTRQASGIPGSDDLTLSLRGRSPLILVDGVPRAISELNPEQIASVTVLKDAVSTVMLGQRSMNGAVLVSTRKGRKTGADYYNFNVQAQAGIQTPTMQRKYLGAYDYAMLYNEALANDGIAPLYSSALDAYKNGTEPYLYPNVDWQKQIFKEYAGFNRYTVNANGKNKALTYMVSLDYLNQGGAFNELDSNAYSTNADYKRYILRSNVNIQLTRTLEGYLNLYGRLNTTNAPAGGSISTVSSELNLTPNNAYPIYNPDGSLGGNINYISNLWGRSVNSGYTQGLTREAFFDFGLKQDLDNLVAGLWTSGKISFSSFTTLTTTRSKSFQVINYSLNPDNSPKYTKLANPSVNQSNSSDLSVSEQTLYAEWLLGYRRNFNKHGIQALATANTENYKLFSSANLPRVITNYAANVKYDWDRKYLAEAAVSYSGLNYYKSGSQFGLFYALGLGWNVHEEEFMKNSTVINQLKIRGSYGLTGGTNQGNFDYLKRYNAGGNYGFGATAAALAGLIEGPIPYENTWSEALKSNIGIDAAFVQNHLSLSFDYFIADQSKLPITRGTNSGILGLNYPVDYIGKSVIKGMELSAGWTADVSEKFGYSIAANFSTSRTKTTFNDERLAAYPGLQRNNQFTNQLYGYIADGFVTSAGEGPVVVGYDAKPGDLKYKDLNGDQVIDYRDLAAIGKAKPMINYGVSTQFRYSGFYLSFLIQGIANSETMLSGNTVFPFLNTTNGGITQAFPESLGRWTPQTAATATFPRLTIGGNVNNYTTSSYWIRNTDYFRLKNVEIGYNISGSFLDKVRIKNIRVFVNGLNLYTYSKFKIFDPEMPFADYAIQKVFNGGLSVTF